MGYLSKFEERGGRWVLAQFVMMGLVGVTGPMGKANAANNGQLGIAGILFVMGAIFGVAGARVLGRNRTAYPVPKDESRLIRHGIYAWVRHPLYSSLTLLGLAWGLAWNSLPALGSTFAMTLLLNAKARFEEQQLREMFDDYEAYQDQVPRFIPRMNAQTMVLLIVLLLGGAALLVWPGTNQP